MNKTLIFTLALLSAVFSHGNHLHAGEGHEGHHHHSEPMEMNHSSGDHHHKTVTISEGQAVPSVDLIVHQDAMKGWNLEINLENFSFAPERVNGENQPNEGHAHLYINGEKITRIYSNWYYISELPKGENEVKIGLNTNSHESLMYQETIIEDAEMITVE